MKFKSTVVFPKIKTLKGGDLNTGLRTRNTKSQLDKISSLSGSSLNQTQLCTKLPHLSDARSDRSAGIQKGSNLPTFTRTKRNRTDRSQLRSLVLDEYVYLHKSEGSNNSYQLLIKNKEKLSVTKINQLWKTSKIKRLEKTLIVWISESQNLLNTNL